MNGCSCCGNPFVGPRDHMENGVYICEPWRRLVPTGSLRVEHVSRSCPNCDALLCSGEWHRSRGVGICQSMRGVPR